MAITDGKTLKLCRNDPSVSGSSVSPPGFCCQPDPDFATSLHDFDSGVTTFYGLQNQQMGFGWSAIGPDPDFDLPECTGLPILRISGPAPNWGQPDPGQYVHNPSGNYHFVDGTPQSVVFAATWIDLRTRFPPDSADARYLQWQGVKGAVWGEE
ncbi:hypothetical protein IMSHALPRED_000716 [Imshaugia aleurites]|uniref:Uncharacterized protein n=1 Tax=Imshaugia aleurites TaxID=172621 RepID=A0A8H3IXT7_9LECA|nr:hypothetical protein IMSHALPRED_000716 [Imshaugia aleurites]